MTKSEIKDAMREVLDEKESKKIKIDYNPTLVGYGPDMGQMPESGMERDMYRAMLRES